MASEIGDLYVILRAVTEPFTRSIKEAAVEGEAATGTIGGAFQKLSSIGMVVGGAAAIAVGATVKMAGDFQAEMTKLVTQAGVAQDKMGGLTDGVLKLAGQVGFSPTSLAESLLHVESNFESMGISSQQALEITKIAAEGAAVGGANLVDVTNALTAALASGIPGVQDINQAMGVLNATVGVGDMKMQDLADAFGSGMVATVKGFGLNIKDVGAALAVFGDNNIRGSLAGNQLRMSVQALAKPVATSSEALHRLGLQQDTLAKDMQQGGLKLAIEDLVDRMHKAGISAEQQGQIITEAFGRKAGAGLNVLVSQYDRLESKYPALDKAATGFADSWQATQRTFNQQLKQTEQSLVAMGIKLGTVLLPYVERFLGWVQKGVGWLTQHKGAVELLAGAIGTTLVAAIIAVGGAMASFLGPELAVAAGIMAVGAAVVYAYNHFTGFRNVVNDIGRFLAGAFTVAWRAAGAVIHWFATTVLPPVRAAIQAVFSWFDAHKEQFRAAWDAVLKAVHAVVQWFNANVLTWIRARVAELVAWWTEHSHQIHQVWSVVWKIVETAVKVWWDGTMRPLLSVVQSVWTVVWGVIKDSIKIVWDVISGVVMTGIHYVENVIGLVLDIITGKWGRVWGDLVRLVGQTLNDVVSTIGNIASGFGDLLWDAGANIVRGLINGIKSMAGGAGRAMHDIASTIRSYLPFSPAKTGPLSGSGSPDLAGAKIGTMVADGIHTSVTGVSRAASRLAGAASLAIGGSAQPGPLAVAAGAPAGGSTAPTYVINLTVQGSVLSDRDLRDVLEREMYRLGMRGSTTWQNYGRR